jgi:hypothetical protein
MTCPTPPHLTALLPALRADGYSVPSSMTYRGIREKALDSRFPAHLDGMFWHFDRADLPAIAQALGLSRAPGRAPAAQQSVAA